MAVVDVMEEKKVKCSVELKGEKYATATECEFAFFDEAKAAIGERLKATVSGGKGEAEWTAPKLAETDGLRGPVYVDNLADATLAALKRPELTDPADVDQDLVVCFGLA